MSTTTEKWTIFGDRLRSELDRQGMSLRQFADKAGITLTTACRYAHSQRTPRATEILKAAKVLRVTCDYMLGLSDDPHKTRDGWTEPGIIKCKNCKYWTVGQKGKPWNIKKRYCNRSATMCMDENDFCSLAERKEHERTD